MTHLARGQALLPVEEPVVVAGTSAPRELETVSFSGQEIPSDDIEIAGPRVWHLQTKGRHSNQLEQKQNAKGLVTFRI